MTQRNGCEAVVRHRPGGAFLACGRALRGLALLLFAPFAPAQLLVALHNNGSLATLDPATAEAHSASPLAGNQLWGELAYDPASGTFWASSTSSFALYTCNPTNGSTTLVGPHLGVAYMHGLAWDTARATLWGVPSDGSLHAIDTTTGGVNAVGPTGLTGYVNLAYDSLRDVLFATDTTTRSLHRIDRNTGAATLVGPLYHALGLQSPSSLAHDPVTDTLFLADNVLRRLFRVDAATGIATLVGSTGTGNLIGLAVVPSGEFRRVPHGCGSVAVDAQGMPLPAGVVGASATAANAVVFGIGLVPGSTPFCTCTLGHEWAIALLRPNVALPIPNHPSFRGMRLALQAVELDGVGGCTAPMAGFSDTFVLTIG